MNSFYNMLLMLAGAYLTYRIFLFYSRNRDLLFLFYGLAAVSVTIAFMDPFIAAIIQKFGFELRGQPFTEWGRICAISFILCGLIEFIRQSKPDFARFPQIFVSFPLLLIVSYPLVMHTVVLRDWLIGIYEISAIFVALVMHGFLSRSEKHHMVVFWGLIATLLAYLLYWLPDNTAGNMAWMWKLTLLIAMVILMIGFEKLETSSIDDGNQLSANINK